MMFKLPRIATMSAIRWSLMMCGKTWKWMNEGRPRPGPPGGLAAVGDEVIAEFAVRALDRRVDLFDRRLQPSVGHDQLEVLDQAFHAVVSRPLVGQGANFSAIGTLTGPVGRFSIAWRTIPMLW